jgi:hypothetical protein
MQGLRRIFAEGSAVVMIGAFAADPVVGWRKIEACFREGFAAASGVDFRHRDVKVRLHPGGNAAWLSCYQDARFEERGRLYDLKAVRVTWGLEKRNGEWRVVQAHWSLVASG